ncbi:hypothetical protein [Arthrobacter sp. MA-N2]|uniref:hypothetical protein n=1 Tax=Arthrobacter sp. MA-N2 TaxID=1101188 RepID=UPI0004809F9C|nr:hypothetical protein [Arthrobacter sp. MA-N2]
MSFAAPDKNVGVVGDGNQAVFSLTISNKSGSRIDASGMSWPKVAYGDNLESATLISNAKITTLLDGDKKTDQFSRFIPATGGGKVRVQIPAPDGGKSAIFEGSVLDS